MFLSSLAGEGLESLSRRRPIAAHFGGVDLLGWERPRDDLAELRQVADETQPHRLHEHVADRGRLDRSGQNGAIDRGGRQAVEQAVLDPAANGVQHLDLPPSEALEAIERFGVAQREAFQAAAGQFAG